MGSGFGETVGTPPPRVFRITPLVKISLARKTHLKIKKILVLVEGLFSNTIDPHSS